MVHLVTLCHPKSIKEVPRAQDLNQSPNYTFLGLSLSTVSLVLLIDRAFVVLIVFVL